MALEWVAPRGSKPPADSTNTNRCWKNCPHRALETSTHLKIGKFTDDELDSCPNAPPSYSVARFSDERLESDPPFSSKRSARLSVDSCRQGLAFDFCIDLFQGFLPWIKPDHE